MAQPATRRTTPTTWRAAAVVVTLALVALVSVCTSTPASAAIGTTTRFTVPGGTNGAGIAAGPDGNVWFVDRTQDLIGRITPQGQITTFTHPDVDQPYGITAGSDGNLWFTFQGRFYPQVPALTDPGIGRITPSGTITLFADGGLAGPSGITLGDDGNVWFANGDSIGRATSAGSITLFPAGVGVAANEITAGPDGRLWFTPGGLTNDGVVGTITTGGTVSFVDLSQDVFSMSWIRAGGDGKLYFSSISNGVGTITTTGTVSFITAPGIAFSGIPALGSDGNMWFSATSQSFTAFAARVTPAGVVTTFPGSGLIGQMTGGPDGNMWFTNAGQIGRIEVAGAAAPSFSDVSPNHPFFADIEWMSEQGISTGYTDGTYRPGAPVTRQAMSAFMYRLAGEPPFDDPPTATFGDVSPSNTFFSEIEWMASEGITNGTPAVPKPLYKPNAPVSRGAMSAFMYRLAGAPPFEDPATTTFGDVSPAHPFFSEIEWMASEGITNGTPGTPKPTYKPATAVSRGAMSAFMHRLADGPGVGI